MPAAGSDGVALAAKGYGLAGRHEKQGLRE